MQENERNTASKAWRVICYMWNETNVQVHPGTRTQVCCNILVLQITGFGAQIFEFKICLCLLTGCVILDNLLSHCELHLSLSTL